jgi:uncharacterized membrane protein
VRPSAQTLALRVIVVVVGVYMVGFGLWAFLSPTGFYSAIAPFPPFNQHFLHDLGAFQVGMGAALLATQAWDDALLALLAGTALGAVIHFIAHLMDSSLGGHPATDIPFLGGLALLLVVAWALRWARRRAAA